LVSGGCVALIDATFLYRCQRALFRNLATELGVPFVILDVSAGDATLRERVKRRAQLGNDASEATAAVLDHQICSNEPIADDERDDVVPCDGELPPAHPNLEGALCRVIERLGTAPTPVRP